MLEHRYYVYEVQAEVTDGAAVLLEEVGKVIMRGGTGVTISSQSGHRLPALGAETGSS